MSGEVLFERDILFPTGNINEPGSIHIRVLSPNQNARIPLVIESKTSHLPYDYLDSIIRILQTDIFDRILVDIKKNVILYFKVGKELINKSNGKPYIKVIHNGTAFESTGADSPE
ncbi:MAG: hypothetical protein FIA99_19290 [Ruminiclostridium sp.]|nr:hypothetical protein [Ruminiclostridium sp.]